MNLIFLDLELNQLQQPKVIQIGAVALNLKTGKRISNFDQYVNPMETLDPYIIDLTGITQKMVDEARPIEEVLPDFWAWVEDQPVANKVVAWGKDIDCLKNIAKELAIPIPQLRELDLKEMARWFKSAKDISEKGGLVTTLGEFGLSFEGTAHNALDDAFNTGRLGVVLFKIIKTAYQLQSVAKGLP